MADMFVDPADDPRNFESTGEGELANYRDYLRNYRLTLELKTQDLTPEQLATRSVPPSTLSLLGLVRHMARVEHFWFQVALQGKDEPRLYADDGDAGFNAADGTQECVDDGFARWKEQIALADSWLAAQDDAVMAETRTFRETDTGTVRDILVHMIEEYARHCGHADLLRECIDGRVGQ